MATLATCQTAVADDDIFLDRVRADLSRAPETWVPNPLPEMPKSFDKHGFVLPVHQTRLLQLQNPFKQDEHIKFDEGPHVYYVDGIPTTRSVTGLVHKFCEEFDADDAIRGMRCSRRWPRQEYSTRDMKKRKRAVDECIDTMCMEDTQAIQYLQAARESVDDDETFFQNVQKLNKLSTRAPAAVATLVSEIADDDDVILQKWDDNRDDAANRGTWMHLQCEMWLNRDECHTDSHEMRLFFEYCRTRLAPLHVRAFRTEPEVHAWDLDLAGSIDFVGVFEDGPNKGKYMIVDWKRSKDLRNKSRHFKGITMAPPLDEIPDSAKWHYALQLNLYAFILERYYGLEVAKLEVACFHPDNEDVPYFFEVPRMREVTACVIAFQQQDCMAKICDRAERRLRAAKNPTPPLLEMPAN